MVKKFIELPDAKAQKANKAKKPVAQKEHMNLTDIEFKIRDLESRLYSMEARLSSTLKQLESRENMLIPADYESERINYPMAAFLGQEKAKKALLLNAINPSVGGVLIRGESGVGKTTLARSLFDIVPEITAVKGCKFHCDPKDEAHMCYECKTKLENQGRLPSHRISAPVVELPLNATEDAVVGRINVRKLMETGEKVYEPGLLAAANRGILFIDDVNLLDDTIVDVLLDVSSQGMNIVEREGARITHPSNFILVGTMNPDEGELRPQFNDRFGLVIDMETLTDIEHRVEIIKRNTAFRENPRRFRERFEQETRNIKLQVEKAKMLYPKVVMPTKLYDTIAEICNEFKAVGHRAEIFIEQVARTNAAYEGKNRVIVDDIIEAADLVLPFRMKKSAFSETLYSSEKTRMVGAKYEEESD